MAFRAVSWTWFRMVDFSQSFPKCGYESLFGSRNSRASATCRKTSWAGVSGREWFDESLGMLVFFLEEADGDVRVFFQQEVFFPTVWAGL